MKNRPLQTGGILSVHDARKMVQQKVVDDVERARQVVEAADKKAHNYTKRVFFEAAKKARKWRLNSILKPLEIWDEKGVHFYRRG
jgi:hypothetical protein